MVVLFVECCCRSLCVSVDWLLSYWWLYYLCSVAVIAGVSLLVGYFALKRSFSGKVCTYTVTCVPVYWPWY